MLRLLLGFAGLVALSLPLVAQTVSDACGGLNPYEIDVDGSITPEQQSCLATIVRYPAAQAVLDVVDPNHQARGARLIEYIDLAVSTETGTVCDAAQQPYSELSPTALRACVAAMPFKYPAAWNYLSGGPDSPLAKVGTETFAQFVTRERVYQAFTAVRGQSLSDPCSHFKPDPGLTAEDLAIDLSIEQALAIDSEREQGLREQRNVCVEYIVANATGEYRNAYRALSGNGYTAGGDVVPSADELVKAIALGNTRTGDTKVSVLSGPTEPPLKPRPPEVALSSWLVDILMFPGTWVVSRIQFWSDAPLSGVWLYAAAVISLWTWLTGLRLAFCIPARAFGFYNPEHFRFFLWLWPWRPLWRVVSVVGRWREEVFSMGRRATAKCAGLLETMTLTFRPGDIFLGRLICGGFLASSRSASAGSVTWR